ncbi:Uncharacterized protein QTN25_010241 [Entamoeba marina]
MNKFISPLFHYTYSYDSEFELESDSQGLTEALKFTHISKKKMYYFSVRNVLEKDKFQTLILNELKTASQIHPNVVELPDGEWGVLPQNTNVKTFTFTSTAPGTFLFFSWFLVNGIFVSIVQMNENDDEDDDLNEVLSGFDVTNAKQSHKLILNGVDAHTIVGDGFKARIPVFFKKVGMLYFASIRLYDDQQIDTKLRLSISIEDVNNEMTLMDHFQQMWGDVKLAMVDMEIGKTQWKVMKYTSTTPVYDVDYHFFAYHKHDEKYTVVWFGTNDMNTMTIGLLTLLLGSIQYDPLCEMDNLISYMHFTPSYTIISPKNFLTLNSAEEYGLISDILPTMFYQPETKSRFFINVSVLGEIGKGKEKEIIESERQSLEYEDQTTILSKTDAKFKSYKCYVDLCETNICGDHVKCIVKYVYLEKDNAYVRFSFSSPPDTFAENYFGNDIPFLMETIKLIAP